MRCIAAVHHSPLAGSWGRALQRCLLCELRRRSEPDPLEIEVQELCEHGAAGSVSRSPRQRLQGINDTIECTHRRFDRNMRRCHNTRLRLSIGDACAGLLEETDAHTRLGYPGTFRCMRFINVYSLAASSQTASTLYRPPRSAAQRHYTLRRSWRS